VSVAAQIARMRPFVKTCQRPRGARSCGAGPTSWSDLHRIGIRPDKSGFASPFLHSLLIFGLLFSWLISGAITQISMGVLSGGDLGFTFGISLATAGIVAGIFFGIFRLVSSAKAKASVRLGGNTVIRLKNWVGACGGERDS